MSVLSRVRGTGTRILGVADLAEAQGVLGRDPAANVFVASRVEASGLDAWRLGGELWGYHVNGRLDALYCTVSVPSMPAWRWPGTWQKNV